MAGFEVDYKEFRRGFQRNNEAGNSLLGSGRNAPGLMLAFYAVECGLKALLLSRNRTLTTRQTNLMSSHDLREMVKELRLVGNFEPKSFRLKKQAPRVECKESHLAWRYGVVLLDEDETALGKSLKMLAAKLQSEL